ncbi:MAG: hypothetical protein RR816_10855, partial [Clostridia bacterium]
LEGFVPSSLFLIRRFSPNSNSPLSSSSAHFELVPLFVQEKTCYDKPVIEKHGQAAAPAPNT